MTTLDDAPDCREHYSIRLFHAYQDMVRIAEQGGTMNEVPVDALMIFAEAGLDLRALEDVYFNN